MVHGAASEDFVILACAVLTQCNSVDRQTDRQTDFSVIAKTGICIARCHPDALQKVKVRHLICFYTSRLMAAIRCPRHKQLGPQIAVQHLGTPSPHSTTLDLYPVPRRLLLISHPAEGKNQG